MLVTSMNCHGQHRPQRIDGQVSPAGGDFLGRVVASFFSALGCANRLAVENGGEGVDFFPSSRRTFSRRVS